MAFPTALLDATVLYPAGLRDFLLRLADQYLYAPLWSADIHAEWIGNLLGDRPDLTGAVLERTRAMMDQHFPDAVVTGYSARASGVALSDADDIHVLAAAIEGGADLIVTRNLRDFPADRLAPHGLTAQHPDAFIYPEEAGELLSCGCTTTYNYYEQAGAGFAERAFKTLQDGNPRPA